MLEFNQPKLQRLYDYWRAKRGDRRMPARADIDPLDMTYVMGDVMLVDVLDEAPARFRIRLHGSNLSRRAGYELTGKMLDELPVNEFRTLVHRNWTEVAGGGEPRRCLRDQIFDGRMRQYESVILPLGKNGEKVDMLLVALLNDDPR